MKRFTFLVFLLSSLLPALTHAQNSDKAEEWIYSVRPGDTIWSVCAQYIDEPQCWQKLGPYNGIDLPRRLPPGSILKIPVAWLKNPPAPVVVKALKGQVFWQQNGSSELLPLSLNHKLNKGDSVITQNGQLVLEFADGAVMQLEQNTRLVFDRLRYVRGSKSLVDTYLRLNKGATQTQITPGRHQYKFQIDTPAGIAAVRGTEFRTQLNPSQASLLTEVLSGKVGVSPSQGEQEVSVESGYGLVSNAGESIGQPERLLDPVQMTSPVAQAAPLKLSWSGDSRATAYKIQVKRADEKIAIINQIVEANSLDLPTLADGRYLVSIQAIAASGLSGQVAESELQLTTELGLLTFDKVELKRDKQMTLAIKPVTNAALYEVEYSYQSDFAESQSLESLEPNVQIALAKPLKKNQTLYIRARAMSTNSKQSAWSETVSLQPQTGTNWLAYAHIVLALSIFLL